MFDNGPEPEFLWQCDCGTSVPSQTPMQITVAMVRASFGSGWAASKLPELVMNGAAFAGYFGRFECKSTYTDAGLQIHPRPLTDWG